ncbi:diguanylate cyclase [Ectothiorhodospiraceae bacterium BW-2]|nr:diguanylate cyclase [Ectothiorhodospiraceae bacterium BW-2]
MSSRSLLPPHQLWSIINAIPSGIVIVNQDLTILYWNEWIENYSQLPHKLVLNQSLEAVFPMLDDSHLLQRIESAIEFQLPVYVSHIFSHSPLPLFNANGEPIEQDFLIHPFRIHHKVYALIQINDVTPSARREQRLEEEIRQKREAERQLLAERKLFMSGPSVMFKWSNEPLSPVLYVSSNVETLFGHSPQQLTSRQLLFEQLIHPDDLHQVQNNTTAQLLLGANSFEKEYRLLCADGSYRWVFDRTIVVPEEESTDVDYYLGYLIDITARKEIEHQISHMAFHDALTNLPNRRMLLEQLQHECARAQRNRYYGALLYLDLDRFKLINDTLGHDVGDELLKGVASRLTQTIRGEDSAARMGGDEFVVLLSRLDVNPIRASADAKIVAAKLVTALSRPYQLLGHQVETTPSIGITLYPGINQPLSDEELLKQADDAMYRIKHGGRCGYALYGEDRLYQCDESLIDERAPPARRLS